MLQKLQSIGINLMPINEDISKNNMISKTYKVKEYAAFVLSILSVSCSFRSTHFSNTKECGSNKIILKIRDNEDRVINYDEDERRDYN